MLRVGQIGLETVGEEMEISAVVDGFRSGERSRRLWFRFPERFAAAVVVSGNPFMASLMPVASRLRTVLQIDRPVSRRFFENSDQTGRIWRKWFGHRLEIAPSGFEDLDSNSPPQGIGCFFSGGVDSFYSVLKNLDRETGEGRITHLVHVRGFDIDLGNDPMYREVSRHLTEAAGELGLPIIMASTNIREVSGGFTSWGKLQHGAAMAGVGHCLSGLFRTVIVPATHTYDHVFPWGSHPLLDPLWSSESLTFLCDGCESSRAQKIFQQIARSPVALRHLRVCFKNTGSGSNCGECEKCLRTMVVLKIAGVLDNCDTLGNSLDLDRVRKIRIKQRITESFARDTLAVLRERNDEHELQKAIEEILSRWTLARVRFRLRDYF